jgi:SpoVK/Ycf46/Vps4 family AAA+-type ATPase
MQQNLSENKLNKIARENYSVLSRYCVVLSEEGYWEEPGKILRKPILEMLDLYIQSCLIKVAMDCNRQLNQAQLHMLTYLTDTNPFAISIDEGVTKEMVEAARRHLSSPPILLQLVGMRDTKKESTMAGLFFDAILNLLLVMSYLSQATAAIYMKCLQEYCETAAIFIRNANNQTTLVDEKYLFRKICVQDLESSTRSLQEVGEDFEKYKENTMFYREKKVSEQKSSTQRRYDEREAPHQAMSDIIEISPESKDSINHKQNDAELMETIEKEKREAKLTKLLQQLDDLIGLEDVKQEIRSLINLIKVKKLREKYRLPEMEMSYHMVFSGNPGTGKTTVARLVAAIYQELGLLSRGTLVETDRSGLVAGYVCYLLTRHIH